MSAPRLRRLAPWEEVQYFKPPKVNSFTLVGSGYTQVAAADPQRVAILFSSNAQQQCVLSPDGTVTSPTGITLPTAYPTLFLTEAQYGPLCTGPWFANGNGVIVTVIEIILRDFPEAER